jgi:hypothetical protein
VAFRSGNRALWASAIYLLGGSMPKSIELFRVDELQLEIVVELYQTEAFSDYIAYCESITFELFTAHCDANGIKFLNRDDVRQWDYRDFQTDNAEINADPYAFIEDGFYQVVHSSLENEIQYLREKEYCFTKEGRYVRYY